MDKKTSAAWHENIDYIWHDTVWPEIQGANRVDDPRDRCLDLSRALRRAVRYYDEMAQQIQDESGK